MGSDIAFYIILTKKNKTQVIARCFANISDFAGRTCRNDLVCYLFMLDLMIIVWKVVMARVIPSRSATLVIPQCHVFEK